MLRFKEIMNCGMALGSGCCRPSPPELMDNCEMDSEYCGMASLLTVEQLAKKGVGDGAELGGDVAAVEIEAIGKLVLWSIHDLQTKKVS